MAKECNCSRCNCNRPSDNWGCLLVIALFIIWKIIDSWPGSMNRRSFELSRDNNQVSCHISGKLASEKVREYLAICDEEQRKLDQRLQSAAVPVPAATQAVTVPAAPPAPLTTPVSPAASAVSSQAASPPPAVLAATPAAVPPSSADQLPAQPDQSQTQQAQPDQASPDQLPAEPTPAAPPTDGAL